jgi:hypothetical protein
MLCSPTTALARSWEVPSIAVLSRAMLASSFFLSPAVSAELRGTSPRLSVAASAVTSTASRTRVRWREGGDTVRTRFTISL